MTEKNKDPRSQQTIEAVLARLPRPKKAIVTAGMPYANGPLHIGHLAGAHVPADIYARYMRMLIGGDNLLFVCGTDDHGSTSEVAAKKLGKSTAEFIGEIHASQSKTMESYGISLDIYTGTSRPENFETHKEVCQEFLRRLYKNNMLEKRTSQQWYDPELKMFLPDRYVQGTCPKPGCGNENAYSEECDVCNSQYESSELKNPRSTVSSSIPVLKDTDHWYLNMWKVTDELIEWLRTKEKSWRKSIMQEVLGMALPSVAFSNQQEDIYKEIKSELPAHKSRYAPGKRVIVQFENLTDLEAGRSQMEDKGIVAEIQDAWAHRSITRDVAWGVPVPEDLDPEMKGKTLYVWPESLIAPISFTKAALKKKGLPEEKYSEFWNDKDSKVFQFLGVDNVFFYVLMQGAMWFGQQEDIHHQPQDGELQLTDIFSSYHLQINGQKMSKSTGNFYTADQLMHEMGYSADQVRYFLANLSLSEKASNFDFEVFNQRNQFLAGPLNAAFEKPISACHSKFDGIIPEGKLIGNTEKETFKVVQNYTRFMSKGEYPKALGMVENYARTINSLFNKHKPHDDRFPLEERADALYSCFYILKNILIMLSPFAPFTMEKLRTSLNFDESIYQIDNLNSAIESGHKIGQMVEFFPKADEVD